MAAKLTSGRRVTWAIAGTIGLAAGGCGSGPTPPPPGKATTTQPTSTTMTERQDAALRDPMNYKPQFGAGPAQNGGITDPAGLNKDLNDVFNP